MIIAESSFTIDSSQQRIWELLLKSVLRFMPFERIKPLSEKSVTALLKVRMGFISLPMNVMVEIVEATPPQLMVTVLEARGMGGIIWLKQRATFTLTSADDEKTEVGCKIALEGMGIMVRIFLMRLVKTFARDSFQGLEDRLRKWA
jgi:carbon monoxide dehydrogenase subunit G